MLVNECVCVGNECCKEWTTEETSTSTTTTDRHRQQQHQHQRGRLNKKQRKWSVNRAPQQRTSIHSGNGQFQIGGNLIRGFASCLYCCWYSSHDHLKIRASRLTSVALVCGEAPSPVTRSGGVVTQAATKLEFVWMENANRKRVQVAVEELLSPHPWRILDKRMSIGRRLWEHWHCDGWRLRWVMMIDGESEGERERERESRDQWFTQQCSANTVQHSLAW